MTFQSLLTSLAAFPADAPLLFETRGQRISGGYHVTELKIADVTGIDCGGQISQFKEARLQLLDGYGGAHMTVGTFRGILKKSLERVPDLADIAFLVEFGVKNAEVRLLAPKDPQNTATGVVVLLEDTAALCKPGARRQADGSNAASCCGATAQSTACCAPAA